VPPPLDLEAAAAGHDDANSKRRRSDCGFVRTFWRRLTRLHALALLLIALPVLALALGLGNRSRHLNPTPPAARSGPPPPLPPPELREAKFLFVHAIVHGDSWLGYGDQLRWLYDQYALASMLGRTLVLPPFAFQVPDYSTTAAKGLSGGDPRRYPVVTREVSQSAVRALPSSSH
jgi:hypothetical protein